MGALLAITFLLFTQPPDHFRATTKMVDQFVDTNKMVDLRPALAALNAQATQLEADMAEYWATFIIIPNSRTTSYIPHHAETAFGYPTECPDWQVAGSVDLFWEFLVTPGDATFVDGLPRVVTDKTGRRDRLGRPLARTIDVMMDKRSYRPRLDWGETVILKKGE